MLFVNKAIESLASKISIRRAQSWRPVERYQKPRQRGELALQG